MEARSNAWSSNSSRTPNFKGWHGLPKDAVYALNRHLVANLIALPVQDDIKA
jgi:hypothetical protein